MLLVDDSHRGIRVLTLHRPAKRNAFNAELYRRCAEALQVAADDPDVSVLVITGSDGNLSSGQDREELSGPELGRMEAGRQFHRMIDGLGRFPKPIVAAVEGAAVGVGMTMLTYCDLVIMGRSARLRAPFIRLGIAPEAGSSVAFVSAFGWHRAAEIFLTGRWVSAEESVAMGFGNEVVADGTALARARALADELLAAGSPEVMRAAKRLLADGRSLALTAARERERATFAALYKDAAPSADPDS